MRTLSLILILTILAVLPAEAQKAVSDDRIYDEVRLKLSNDRDVGGMAINVEVSKGVVTLKGRVEKDKLKEKAEHIAKKVKGVKSVDNRITIGPRS